MRALVICAVVGSVCFITAAKFLNLANEASDTAARSEARAWEAHARMASARYDADGRMVAVGDYDRDAYGRDRNLLQSSRELVVFERGLVSGRRSVAGAFGAVGTLALALGAWHWQRGRRRRRLGGWTSGSAAAPS